ncbi:MAG: hypothetical protein QNJ09_07965 [Paracoccaceae bacterium]|nr:hypothetical protein [Paracoccaceae bacterium]
MIGQTEVSDATLSDPSGPVYPPGPEAARRAASYGAFVDLQTNGCEVCLTPIFNQGPMDTGVLECPLCEVVLEAEDEEAFYEQLDAIGTAAAAHDFSPNAVKCVSSDAETLVNDWAPENGFILAGFDLALWNWPDMPELEAPLRTALEAAFDGYPIVKGGYSI